MAVGKALPQINSDILKYLDGTSALGARPAIHDERFEVCDTSYFVTESVEGCWKTLDLSAELNN